MVIVDGINYYLSNAEHIRLIEILLDIFMGNAVRNSFITMIEISRVMNGCRQTFQFIFKVELYTFYVR